jgi:hypothetical protein
MNTFGIGGNLDEAFRNMWVVGCNTKVKKALHHISINPFKGERLTDVQILKIVERCEQKYGYKPDDHQRVIVEHVKDGRQHFHVIWNRVSLRTNKAVWPGEHWKKSKQVCREMEKELGLRVVQPKKYKRILKIPALFDDGQELYPKRKGKSGKGDGHGGGAGSILSAFKTTQQELTRPVILNEPSKRIANGPDRRRRNLWVPVERRDQGPNGQ